MECISAYRQSVHRAGHYSTHVLPMESREDGPDMGLQPYETLYRRSYYIWLEELEDRERCTVQRRTTPRLSQLEAPRPDKAVIQARREE